MSAISECMSLDDSSGHHSDNLEETEHPSDFEMDMDVKLDEGHLPITAGNSSSTAAKPTGPGHGGMGTTRLDLEEALDDGLSIVASSGFIYGRSITTQQSSHRSARTPSSAISEAPNVSKESSNSASTPSTLSTSYAPRKTREFMQRAMISPNGIQGPSFIDEEKETEWNPGHISGP